jgi:hypothetical protein
VSAILAPETLSRLDTFYDVTLKPKLDAVDERRREVRWLIIKSLIILLPPIAVLIAGDLLDGLDLPFSSVTAMVAAGLWLLTGFVFVVVRYFLPGVTAYANYRSRFKQDVVAEIFKVVCPSAVYESAQGITDAVFDAPGLFNVRGGFESDDRVRGHIGRTPFEASEVGRSYSTGSGKHARSYTVFRGLFFHLDSNQQVHGVTLVEPKEAKSHQIGSREGLSAISFDDTAFEEAFKVYTSDDAQASALLTPAMRGDVLALRKHAGKPVFLAFKGRRLYVAVHYDRKLFEPGIAVSTSKGAVREIAEQFALVETIVRELDLNASRFDTTPDDSLLHGAGIEPNPLTRLADQKAGSMTTSDVWAMAAASIDDSAKDGDTLAIRPEGTRIRVEQGPGTLSITYGLRVGFWVMFAISLSGAALAASALRAESAPEWVRPVSEWVRTLPPVPWLDAFAADAPTPWLIVGSVVAALFALMWTAYVRRVVIESDGIRIYRGLRPLPRVYHRPLYGRAMRINNALYIAKSNGVHMMNPTASPMLTEPEARWLTSEMKRVLGQSR